MFGDGTNRGSDLADHYARLNSRLLEPREEDTHNYIALRNRVAQLLRFRQIERAGNSVPPSIVERQYELVEETLTKIDPEWRQQ